MFPHIFLYVAATDQLARADADSLPLQTRMEAIVMDVHGAYLFREDDGDYLDVRKWRGVFFNDDDQMEFIDWNLTHVLGATRIAK